ncbi:protein madd-4 isoform X2 [Athalia rosae]|uniref:protein madd-4 isoform X2 n=1 Tax=Athalia rosae TaxID=37344 RepID=UPI00203346D3|nr:protein madd-4 isoform X2 [Athalia rosae]
MRKPGNLVKMERLKLILICVVGLVIAENTSTDDTSRIAHTDNSLEVDTVAQAINWGEWLPWSKWSVCSRTCGGGIVRQQRRCRRPPCRGRSVRYKTCNAQPCQREGSDFRAEQCSAFDGVPYNGDLLKWTPYHDPGRPCSLICRGEMRRGREEGEEIRNGVSDVEISGAVMIGDKILERDDNVLQDTDSEESSVVVQLAEKVADGTRCRFGSSEVCVNGECVKVGCDLRIGSNKKNDACGVCGGDGSTCGSIYYWALVPISVCSKPCGGGFKMAMIVCKTRGTEEEVMDSHCEENEKPDKSLIPCNEHTCSTNFSVIQRWTTGQWAECSASCGGGTRTRPVFCSEESNETSTRLPEHMCIGSHKPRHQETCNTLSCPMWETNEWSECSTSCGTGIRTRLVTCKDGKGRLSKDCDVLEKPHNEQECRSIVCPTPSIDELTQPLMQPYPPPPVPEKLIGQPIPSESTFIAEEWSPCSVTCGEGIRHREVHCKIFLEFSRTIAKLPDRQCSGPKPIDTEKCTLEACGLLGNSLSHRMDTVRDSGYAESSLTDTYRSSSSGSGGTSYESSVRVAAGSATHTSYSWKENGYTHCSASCLGGVQELIITCIRDSDGRVVTPYLCSPETRPESRIRTCNDHPCPPRWNFSDFAPCMSPCGLGIQTRDVTCIHEVARGGTNTVHVPNNMCPQPPPPDRRYCNILDCPVKWSIGEWGKCSKTCGGGVKKRTVACEQVMAQGHQQIRPEAACVTRKPAEQRPCNTRACYDLDSSAQPIIFSENTSFSQSDPNKKVDLRIGGTAMVFHGTAIVKIRCPVKKFDKAHIIWTKDRIELRKSKKYKISKKGALRIVDINYSDNGVYACIAGQSQAEVHLLVKARPGEYMSSEEILRHGKTVHHQDVSLDSAPSLSGEVLHTDHAAPAYGSPFSFNGEDFSHEAHPEGIVTPKPTRKPRKKNKRPSPVPPDATMIHGEYTVTSLHQPGYQESVESTATSGATRLLPHLSGLISRLKAYWPFQGDGMGSRGHRMAPQFPEESSKVRVEVDSPATRTLREWKSGRDFVDDIDSDFGILRGNTGIPDEKFGPDEERIIIDDDPYDLDEAIFALQNGDDARSTPKMITHVRKATTPTKSAIDFIEESIRNAKRKEAENAEKDIIRVEKKNTKSTDLVGELISVVKHRRDNDSGEISGEGTEVENAGIFGLESTNVGGKANAEADSIPSQGGILDEYEKTLINEQPDKRTGDEATVTRANHNVAEQTNSVITSEPEVTENLTSEEMQFLRTTGPGAEIEDSEKSAINRDNEQSEPNQLPEGSSTRYPEFDEKTASQKSSTEIGGPRGTVNTWEIFTSTAFENGNTDDHSTLQPVVILERSLAEDLKFEWVMTEWSECSQTCGGGGFQMRGTQCTVRPLKMATNSTQVAPKTAVDATLCEDAGFPVPEKVRACGSGVCPQWQTGEWTPCESSRCFTWQTAMQRREVTCRIIEEGANSTRNGTILDPSKCDESVRPPQRSECYNDACKGVWRVGEWSECTASCEEDGVKYRILQCVWFGTKKAAGNACRDIPRPSVMKTCKGAPCLQAPDHCKDLSQFCGRVKAMNMCRVPLYQKQCCQSCHRQS